MAARADAILLAWLLAVDGVHVVWAGQDVLLVLVADLLAAAVRLSVVLKAQSNATIRSAGPYRLVPHTGTSLSLSLVCGTRQRQRGIEQAGVVTYLVQRAPRSGRLWQVATRVGSGVR